jgi:putative hemolysin
VGDPTIPLPVVILLSILLLCALAFIVYLLFRIRTLSQRVSEEDIRLMVDMGEENGEIEKEEKELIENVFEFNNSTAADVMVHRTDTVMIWAEDTPEEIMEVIRSSGLTRFPVYEEDTDDIIGILNTRDYLLNAQEKRPKALRQLLRKAYFVPETVRTDVLFRDMQSRKVHLAVVVDEYGGTSGIITMEDLLEELVGNIYDEFDPLDEQQIVPLGENLWRISGSAPLEDIAEALDMEFPEDEETETLGGLVFTRLDVIPADGTHPVVDTDGLHIQVEELSDRRVEWAKVSKLPPEGEDPGK